MASDEQDRQEARHDAEELAAAEAALAAAERAEQAREGALPVSPAPHWADMHDADLAGPQYTGGYHIEGRD
jgi:hypothetical protein